MGLKRKEVAGHVLEHETFQPAQIEQTERQRLFHRGEKGFSRIGALDLQQSAHHAHRPAGVAGPEGRNVTIECGMLRTQPLLFRGGLAFTRSRQGMMLRQGLSCIVPADQPWMRGEERATTVDLQLIGIQVDRDRLTDPAFGHGVTGGDQNAP